VRRSGSAEDPELQAENFVIEVASGRGWEAAVFDHFSTVATAIAAKVRLGAGSRHGEAIGGATYSFDLNDEHPARERVLGLLTRMRGDVDALWQEVSDWNRAHPIPDEHKTRVSFAAYNEPWHGPFTVHAVDLDTHGSSALLSSARLTGGGGGMSLFATDSMLVVGTHRFDLTTLEVTPLTADYARWYAFHGDRLIMTDGYRAVDEIDLGTGQQRRLLTERDVDCPIATADGLFGRVYVMRHGLWESALVRFAP
jgi:hypothetical protein